MQQWRDQRKAKGMCCSCFSKVSRPNKRQCESCAEKRRQRERARYKNGLCGCGRPRQTGKSKCIECKKRHAEWIKNPVNKARWQERVNTQNAARRIRVIMHYGGKCVCCGESGMPFLTLDHRDNDGKIDRAQVHSGYWWRWIIKHGYPSNLQVMCWNCNMAKQHFGKGTCPHQLGR